MGNMSSNNINSEVLWQIVLSGYLESQIVSF